MIKIVNSYIKELIEMNRFVENQPIYKNGNRRIAVQRIVSAAFLLLSIANIITKSYIMLIFTAAGSIINTLAAIVAKKTKNASICALSSIITCSALFAFFVVYGGNDGFSCQWVVTLPFMSMIVMNFAVGFFSSLFFQIFLFVVFWTPIRDMLYYRYNDQFCLRFPLYFLIIFVLSLSLAISLRKSQYNECKHLYELEQMNASAHDLARIDPLTELANRRCAYEEFETRFNGNDSLHCIVMGDIDDFKIINDTYGHELGDEVLTILAKLINDMLPQDYLKARWGGEEFLFAANEPLMAVYDKIENLRKAIAAHKFDFDGTAVRITITFGIAEYSGADGLNDALIAADNRLYMGKKAQKNCTVTE